MLLLAQVFTFVCVNMPYYSIETMFQLCTDVVTIYVLYLNKIVEEACFLFLAEAAYEIYISLYKMITPRVNF